MSARVAVVGAGAAGTTVALRLLAARRCEVLLVDPAPTAGPGVAYATPADEHLLNVPAGRMSADPDDPDGFVRFLGPGAAASAFVPRARFGAYLAATFAAAAGPGTRVAEQVTGIDRARGGLVLTLGGGARLPVDAAVCAVGSPPPGVAWAPDALRGSPRFVPDPWAAGAVSSLPGTGDVLVVGTGLTMVDLALAIARPGRTVHAVSRHGLLPRAHAAVPAPPEPPPAHVTHASDVRRAVAAHLRRSLRDQRDWRPALDGLRPHTTPLWQRMSDAERRAFLRGDAARWDVRRHRMPPESARRITALREAGLLRVTRGEVTAFRDGPGTADVTLRDGRTLAVAAVVNATGSVGGGRGELATRLVASGLARPGPCDLGLDTAPDGAVLPPSGPGLPLWVVGALRRGTLWESTAYPEIRAQAGVVAAAVLDRVAPQLSRTA